MPMAELDVNALPSFIDEFDQAAIEIEAEQHQSLGLLDDLRALFMWVEAPKERVSKTMRIAARSSPDQMHQSS